MHPEEGCASKAVEQRAVGVTVEGFYLLHTPPRRMVPHNGKSFCRGRLLVKVQDLWQTHGWGLKLGSGGSDPRPYPLLIS